MDKHEREITFYGKWPSTFSIDTLVKAGFIYLDFQDYVQCPQCKIVLKDWRPEDNALRRHMEACPKCPFLLGQQKKRVQIHLEPKFPKMKQLEARKSTFLGWIRYQKDVLPEQGFFYTGYRDRIQCYLCGILILLKNSDPSLEHEKYNCPIPLILRQCKPRPIPRASLRVFCRYPDMKEWDQRHLTFQKTPFPEKSIQEWIQNGFFYAEEADRICCYVCGDSFGWQESMESVKRKHASENCLLAHILKQSKGDERKLCNLCYTYPKDMISKDCGHVIGCETCIYQLEVCPLCRKPITGRMRIYD